MRLSSQSVIDMLPINYMFSDDHFSERKSDAACIIVGYQTGLRSSPYVSTSPVLCSYENALKFADVLGSRCNNGSKNSDNVDKTGYGDYILINIHHMRRLGLVPDFIVYDSHLKHGDDLTREYNCEKILLKDLNRFDIYCELEKRVKRPGITETLRELNARLGELEDKIRLNVDSKVLLAEVERLRAKFN